MVPLIKPKLREDQNDKLQEKGLRSLFKPGESGCSPLHLHPGVSRSTLRSTVLGSELEIFQVRPLWNLQIMHVLNVGGPSFPPSKTQ